MCLPAPVAEVDYSHILIVHIGIQIRIYSLKMQNCIFIFSFFPVFCTLFLEFSVFLLCLSVFVCVLYFPDIFLWFFSASTAHFCVWLFFLFLLRFHVNCVFLNLLNWCRKARLDLVKFCFLFFDLFIWMLCTSCQDVFFICLYFVPLHMFS